jgi:hypothetical protein
VTVSRGAADLSSVRRRPKQKVDAVYAVSVECLCEVDNAFRPQRCTWDKGRDFFHHQPGAVGLHDFPSAFHRTGVSEFSWSSPAPDAEDQEEGVSDCGWPPGSQVAIGDAVAGRAP